MDAAALISERSDLLEDAIALTFDDGPARWTDPILDTLARNDVRATFFVIGEAIPGREDVLRRIVAEGHEVGNHTFRHPRLWEVTPERVEEEVTLGRQAIEAILGAAPAHFRLPGFGYNAEVLRAVGACGYSSAIQASVHTDDFNNPSHDAIAQAILRDVRRGSIIDLHDGKPPSEPPEAMGGTRDDRDPTVAAVEMLVPELLKRGFRFCTVSELLAL